MRTYTVTFSGTMYFEANSAEEASKLMSATLSEIASDYEVVVSE